MALMASHIMSYHDNMLIILNYHQRLISGQFGDMTSNDLALTCHDQQTHPAMMLCRGTGSMRGGKGE